MTRRGIPLATTRIIATVDNGVGWLTFNSPERRNAISLDMWQGMADAAHAFALDPEVRVVVMHGAGGKAFASGADISEFETQRANAEQKRRYGEISQRGHEALATLDKPLIAMIQGFCICGGLAIALAADLRFATPNSRFGIPAAKLGLGYDYPGLATLARLVGPSRAKDILFSARFLEAAEAQAFGLVNAVVDDARLEAHVAEYAARVAANAPLTVHAAKVALRAFEAYSTLPNGAEIAALVDRCFDKRTPVFKGR